MNFSYFMFDMITLTRKLKKDCPEPHALDPSRRISVRDRLLVKEVPEMEQTLPTTCALHFADHDTLSQFTLTVTPEEGYWLGAKVIFSVFVTEEYNMAPPEVKCLSKLWHPNINEEGNICLSLLRQNSIDGLGWAPTRRLKDVVWGLNSLFTDLLNFEDPLNVEAAEQYQKNKYEFHKKVREYIAMNAKR